MRKTITLPEAIEDAVREYQTIQMRVRKRDVPFTETLVTLVALGIATVEVMTDRTTPAPDAFQDRIMNAWVAIDRAHEARMNGIQDMASEATAELVRTFHTRATEWSGPVIDTVPVTKEKPHGVD